jgi:hypothetical protein
MRIGWDPHLIASTAPTTHRQAGGSQRKGKPSARHGNASHGIAHATGTRYQVARPTPSPTLPQTYATPPPGHPATRPPGHPSTRPRPHTATPSPGHPITRPRQHAPPPTLPSTRPRQRPATRARYHPATAPRPRARIAPHGPARAAARTNESPGTGPGLVVDLAGEGARRAGLVGRITTASDSVPDGDTQGRRVQRGERGQPLPTACLIHG